MHFALLDHDPQQRNTLESLLKAGGHACSSFERQEALQSHLMTAEPDLLLIHWFDSRDETSGASLLNRIHELWPELPLLVIASAPPEDATIRLLATRPAEVLLKPVRRNELLLRLQLLIERYRPGRAHDHVIAYGHFEFLMDRLQLRFGHQIIPVTQKEFALALLFFQHLGRPLSRAFIHEAVWSGDAELSSRTLDTHVSRVRTKLGLTPGRGYRLVPVYSFGYRLEDITE
jgi:DNA-binding response OmpR family regulator